METCVQDVAVDALAQLRGRIAECLLEIDEITLQVNPQIEADYAVKVGCWENELLQAQLAARRAKRKLALAQACANRGEEVLSCQLEQALDEELAQWIALVDAAKQDFLAKLELKAASRALNPADARELKDLHRALVKRLHPDMRPELGEEGRRLFFIAQASFERGDLEALRSLEVATGHLAQDAPEPEDEDERSAEAELLAAQLRVTQERLAALKAANPYALRVKLADALWVHSTVSELKRQVEEQKQVAAAYDARFRELVGEG